MDDTAFFYSRTLRIIMILAIVVPLVGIGGLLWYFSRGDDAEPPAIEEQATLDETVESTAFVQNSELEDDNNPLKPVGPKASTRVTPGGTVCPLGGGSSCDSCS
jgi:hypothetical protein